MKYKVEHNAKFVHVEFCKPVKILSSAILNGGFQTASHFLNAKVASNFNKNKPEFEKPEISLSKLATNNLWQGVCVGMMTAAEMKTFCRLRVEKQGIWIEAMVTAGTSNARRAGDPADYQFMNETCKKTGTINILVLTNARLTQSAMAECIMMIAEAKAVCMQDLNVKSKITSRIASGTGTDSAAIACGDSGPQIQYCGKHVLFGELLANLVKDAIRASLQTK